MKPMHAQWGLVALSDLVARAKLHVPLGELRESIATKKKYDHIKLKVDIEEPVKGHFPSPPVFVRYYTEPSDLRPSATFLEEHNGDEVIVFLLDLAGEDSLAGDTPDALIPFTADDFSKIANEVKNQEEIVQHFDELTIGKATAADAEVRKLFEGLTKKHTQQVAWAQLLKLSRQDVPAIIRVMDDRRRIPDFDAYVPNLAPDAVEKYRHEGATNILEAALTILNHITGVSFRDVHGWRVWCAYNF